MRRTAITRVEVAVLAVLAVFAVGVVALLLMRQRENGLRLQCMDNLRRIGMAVHAQGPRLPPARIAPDYATWAVLLAPNLADKHPLTKWDVSRTYFAQDAAVREALMPVYFCPARQRPAWLSVAGDIDPATKTHLPGALGDYAGVAGTGDPARPWDTADADGAIILGEVLERQGDRIVRWQSRTSLTAIQAVRGLSVTLLIGETHVPAGGLGRADDGDGSLYNGANPASCSRVAGPGHGLAASPDDPFNLNFGSAHPGLCQFLLADGSGHVLAVGVSETVLGQMARREK
jgi:hypothetical protein